MEMTRVKSDNVHSIGYDHEAKTLAVRFLAKDKKSPGRLYHYPDADPKHHEAMSKPGASVGAYVHKHFVKTKHRFTNPKE